MLQQFDFVQFHLISLTFTFAKLSMKFLLFDFGQFCISLISVISVDGDCERQNSFYRSYLSQCSFFTVCPNVIR